MKRSPMPRRSKPIRRVSKKMRGRLAGPYATAKAEVDARADGRCEMVSPVCEGYGYEHHHLKGRVGDLLTDSEWIVLTCRSCHDYAGDNPALAYERGWMASRHGGAS